jgi:hypothetical protein
MSAPAGPSVVERWTFLVRRLLAWVGPVVTWAGVGTFVIWAVGQLARDATFVTGLCFYLPSVLAAGVLVVVAVTLAVARRRRAALVFALLAAPPLAVVGVVENDFTPKPPSPPGEYKLVHWNTKGRPARPGVGEYLLMEQADLYVLTDVGGPAHVEAFRDQLGPGYAGETFGELAVVGRGRVEVGEELAHRGEFVVRAVTWTPDDRPISLLVVDLPSDIWIARDPMLREVNEFIDRRRPDLVVGDFNAPRRSWALANLPDGYRHAYHTAGGGWGATWRVRTPMYAIDQCIHGPRVRPASYRLGGLGGQSDHLFQVFEFGLSQG